MDFGLIDLPNPKWDSETGRQVILKGDFAAIEAAILQSFGVLAPPNIVWVDATSIKVPATPDSIAQAMMIGFPSIRHPGLFIQGGLTDGKYRENTADITLDLDLATNLWGNEKASQWYAIYAISGNIDNGFILKAMPILRVSSQASQVITLRNNLNSANIGYGFTTDELVDSLIYVLSGASLGLLREITANNNDNGTGGTITYGGTALTLTQGDWFIVLPNTNFRLLGDFFNDSGNNLKQFIRTGNVVQWGDGTYYASPGAGGVIEIPQLISPLATKATLMADGTDYIYLGHPSLTSVRSPLFQDRCMAKGYLNLTATVNISQCKVYYSPTISLGNIYGIDYQYPPGCGY